MTGTFPCPTSKLYPLHPDTSSVLLTVRLSDVSKSPNRVYKDLLTNQAYRSPGEAYSYAVK